MKKIILLFLMLSSFAFSQKIFRNKVNTVYINGGGVDSSLIYSGLIDSMIFYQVGYDSLTKTHWSSSSVYSVQPWYRFGDDSTTSIFKAGQNLFINYTDQDDLGAYYPDSSVYSDIYLNYSQDKIIWEKKIYSKIGGGIDIDLGKWYAHAPEMFYSYFRVCFIDTTKRKMIYYDKLKCNGCTNN